MAGLHAAFTSLEGGCLCSPGQNYSLKAHVVVMGCIRVFLIKSQSCLCISRSCLDSKTHECKLRLVRYHVQISCNLSKYLQRHLVCISSPNRTFLLNQLGLSFSQTHTQTGLISIRKKTGILRRGYVEDGQLKPL